MRSLMRLLFWATALSTCDATWYGANYWNDRYGDYGIDYDTTDMFNGLWSANSQVDQGYGRPPADYSSRTCSGCTCDEVTKTVDCSSASTVTIQNYDFENLTASTFSSSVTEITIIGNLKHIRNGTFAGLTNLQKLTIHNTEITSVPDLSDCTSLEWLDLSRNQINFDVSTFEHPGFSSTITRISLMDNLIDWVPNDLFSNLNVEYLGLSRNQIELFPSQAVRKMSNLVFLSVDGNLIETISRRNLEPLIDSSLQHLNLSNNLINYISPNAFSQIHGLKILELHRNNLAEIKAGTFDKIRNILHIDLNYNRLQTLSSKAFTNMPTLRTLIVHNQQIDYELTTIKFDAFVNINGNLTTLFLSSNALPTFPHAVFAEEDYVELKYLHIDNNQISNITEFTSDAYGALYLEYYAIKLQEHNPFYTMRYLEELYISSNFIQGINEEDLCNFEALWRLDMNSNNLDETTLHENVFTCVSTLSTLEMNSNNFQYVPDAVQYGDRLPNINTLDLAGNRITFLLEGHFSNVTSLASLYLSSNDIASIEDGTFPAGIGYLSLGSNSFDFLHENPFRNLSQLVTLDLSNNQIEEIPDTAFDGCINLDALYLTNNKIGRILVTTFEDCPLQNQLSVSGNELAYIEDGSFDHVTSTNYLYFHSNDLTELPLGGDFDALSITILNFDSNRITSVPTDAFKDVTNLQRLYLSNNQISHISRNAFNTISGSSLYIYLNGNPLKVIDSYAFNTISGGHTVYLNSMELTTLPSYFMYDVSFSQDILLYYNQITTIEEDAFYDTTVGQNLRLDNNVITDIQGRLFGGSCSVNELYLQNNLLPSLPSDTFDAVSTQEIYLEYNRLTSFPGSALSTQTLEEIDISNNLISNIPSDAFATHSSLKVLDLSYNQVLDIPAGLLEPLTSLEEFHFQNNNISAVGEGAFNDLGNLLEIDLQNNYLTYWPSIGNVPELKYLYLQNNQIYSVQDSAFKDLDNLTLSSIDLDGNNLGCDCWFYQAVLSRRDFIYSGECSSPTRAVGVTFNILQINSVNYFLNIDAALFQCNPPEVNVSAPAPLEVEVSWSAPPYLNAGKIDVTSDDWIYFVNCTAVSAPTLSTVTNSTQYLFVALDGVEYGTEYGCVLQLHVDNDTSIPTVPVYVTTIEATAPSPNSSVVDLDLTFSVNYYDFSASDTDFNSLTKSKYDSPTYIPSPYGSWLAISNTPTLDTFSHWFRDNPSVNHAFEFSLTAEWDNSSSVNNPVNRFYSSSYFPLDGLGFRSEGSKDCSSVLHNFGFTSVIRTAIKMNGTEQITLGGGEEIWLYVNQILVLQVHGVSSGATPCKTISLADGVGGGNMVPQEGTIVNGKCSITSSVPSETVFANFYLGDSYRFDVFHTEREPCSSEYLFEIQGTEFISENSDTPPVDYSVHISEGLNINGLIETVWVADAFSTGPSFNVTIISGNEARHFSVKNDTTENRNSGVVPTTDAPTPTHSINGTDFIICDVNPELVPDTVTPGSEEFSANTDTVLITLRSEVDYEVETEYLLRLSVVDDNATPPQSGDLTVQIYIDDVNDHCPILPNDTLDLFPLPVLRQDPIANMTATDLDNGLNGLVTYHSTQTAYLTQIGNSSYYLLELTIAALDSGTPTRGDIASVNITISDTCVFDADSEMLEQEVYMGYEDGGLYLRVPKYYLYEYDCKDGLGMESGVIQDDQISASSISDYLHPAYRGRLLMKADPDIPAGSGWIAGTSDSSQWFQVDMEVVTIFGGVVTQGSADEEYWVETYKVAYSNDSTTWVYVKDNDGSEKVFTGNSDKNGRRRRVFDDVYGRYIRILPQSWNTEIALRLEILGCTPERRLRHLYSCERCLTTNYCIGDGLQRPCGRCEDGGDDCNYAPTEHSFGHASECSPCPPGWICHEGYADVCPKYTYATCNSTYCPESCTQCEPGTACFSGIQTICPAGYYSKGTTSELCIPCEPGSYQDKEGQSSCDCCSAGFYSTDAKTSCAPCQVTEYSVGDCTGCQSCASISDCPCMTQPVPCTDGVTCVNTGGGGSYRCLDCPEGMEGSGNNCTDINECDLANPCWDTDSCVNLVPGYECGGCPPGYSGDTPHGIGVAHAEANTQTCTDLNECEVDNGGCDVNVECINTEGGFSCGTCPEGYLGNGATGCIASNYCELGSNNCHQNATCIYTGAGTFACQCNHFFAGNGQFCEEDPDLDGIPVISVSCLDPECFADNCVDIPNSGQEDNDNDQLGDVCDNDDDGDAIYDDSDNCPFVANQDQTDTDGDGIGDVCDNCQSNVNSDQVDSDGDGDGDECDSDDDDDGVLDTDPDNCQFASNSDQSDSDGDGVGDVCDNCPDTSNSDQADSDQNGYGDSCDTPGASYQDRDGDGILDLDDNCISIANADQTDNDIDGIGDECDSDKDGDGISDSEDNCPMVSNVGQTDDNGDGIGDDCEDDYDGDGVVDPDDDCPKSSKYQSTDFSSYMSVELDNSLTDAYSPEWLINDAGRDIHYINDTEMPSMLVGLDGYGPVDYSGTFYVNGDTGDNFIGFVFGYQSNRKFYLVMWKHRNSNNPSYSPGLKGLLIKKVASSSGPGGTLADAIWYSQSTTGETEVLWHDPTMTGWEYRTAYRWYLSHRPSVGLIRLTVMEGANTLVDSGNVYDTSYAGGRLGVFVYDEPNVIWSQLKAKCMDRVNQALMFDGIDDYVILPSLKNLSIESSFTLEAWVYLEDAAPSTKMPVMCSSEGSLCFYIKNGLVWSKFGISDFNTSSSLVESAWNHIAMRYDAQNLEMSLFVNGSLDTSQSNVLSQSWDNDTLLYIGADNGTTYLEAIVDEIRVWGLALLDTEIEEHMQLAYLERQKHKRLLDAHFSMDNEEDGDTTLLDQGIYGHHGDIQGGALFVSSSLDAGRFEVTYPDTRRRRKRGLFHQHEEL